MTLILIILSVIMLFVLVWCIFATNDAEEVLRKLSPDQEEDTEEDDDPTDW